MAGLFRIFFCLVLLLAGSGVSSMRAADAETRAFNAAEKYWQDKFHDRAEREFANFIASHPASPRVPQALLLQARAALAQKKYAGAVDLLTTNLARAAGMADQFQMQIAQVHEQSGQHAAAAEAFAAVVARYTNSPLRLPATLGEAKARFELKQWARVSDLLQNPSGVFVQAVAQRPDSDTVTDGRLLLAEALLEQRRYAAAEAAAASIPDAALFGESRWRREYLRAQAQFGAQKLPAALATSSNVVAAGAAILKPALEAAGIALQGEILEALNQPAEAIAAYEQNQRADMPPERIREAVFKCVSLSVAHGQLSNAVARLERFLEQRPTEEGSDVALLAVAELRLRQHQLSTQRTNGASLSPGQSATNLLAEAIASASRVVETFTNSPFLGQAHLVRGWAFLARGQATESLSAFRRAADALPWSEEQAVARFKTADLEFHFREFTNSLRNYRRILSEYSALPRVQSELVPRARYQMLQASRETGDLDAATEVIAPILREYPPNNLTERTLLLYGQTLDEAGQPARARAEFSNLIARFPNWALRPEVELAIARSLERERNWTAAISKYESWVAAYPTNQNLPEAEYHRAVATYQAGQTTNALRLFTNFVARFRSHPLAQRAQYAVGDLYFNWEQYLDAEREYQRVFDPNGNWPVNSLTWEARLKAGRAAMKRQNNDDARPYFIYLINEPSTPKRVVVQASFAFADTYRGPTTNVIESVKTARNLYRQIEQFHPDDPLVWRALGEVGTCYFLLGGLENPTNYVAALEAFARITNSPLADISARVQAQVGIGNVLRHQARIEQTNGNPAQATALLDAALQNYLSVLYASYDEEVPEPTWIREAGDKAAEIAESLNKWDSAFRVYQRLAEMVPTLRGSLERRMANAKEKALLQ